MRKLADAMSNYPTYLPHPRAPEVTMHPCPDPDCDGETRTEGVPCGRCTTQRAIRERDSQMVLQQLEALGINVPARGRYPLGEVLETVGDPEVEEAVWDFVDEVKAAGRWIPVRGLILEGPTGTGKSWILAGIIRELIESGTYRPSQIEYDSSREVWGLIKSGYGSGTASRDLRRRMSVPFWGLDDFGVETPTEDTGSNLTEILTNRELRPTVITANLPRDRHGDRFDDPAVWERIKSRLGDRNFRVLTVTGPDHRQKEPA